MEVKYLTKSKERVLAFASFKLNTVDCKWFCSIYVGVDSRRVYYLKGLLFFLEVYSTKKSIHSVSNSYE